MPKMKTHSGTKKRVKKTGSGKLMHEQVNKRHRLEVKLQRKRSRKTWRPGGLRRSRLPTPRTSSACSACADRPRSPNTKE